MNYTLIMKRSWHILWHYRLLWIFGFVLALLSSGGSSRFTSSFDAADINREMQSLRIDAPFMPEDLIITQTVRSWSEFGDAVREFIDLIPAWGWWLGGSLLLLSLFLAAIRYIAETALLRMVNDYESTGSKRSFREGVRFGWSWAALHLFLLDLLLTIAAILLSIPFLLAGFFWLSASLFGSEPSLGWAAAICCLCIPFALFAIVCGIVLAYTRILGTRAIALEGRGAWTGFWLGLRTFRENLKDMIVMGLIMVVVSIVTALVLIPIGLGLFFVGALVGGGIGLAVFELAGTTSASEAAQWVFAFVAGLPVFLIIMAIPMAAMRSFVEVFSSSVWTLVFRSARGLDAPSPAPDYPEGADDGSIESEAASIESDASAAAVDADAIESEASAVESEVEAIESEAAAIESEVDDFESGGNTLDQEG